MMGKQRQTKKNFGCNPPPPPHRFPIFVKKKKKNTVEPERDSKATVLQKQRSEEKKNINGLFRSL